MFLIIFFSALSWSCNQKIRNFANFGKMQILLPYYSSKFLRVLILAHRIFSSLFPRIIFAHGDTWVTLRVSILTQKRKILAIWQKITTDLKKWPVQPFCFFNGRLHWQKFHFFSMQQIARKKKMEKKIRVAPA